jgi:hypothetical protein
MNKKLTGHVDFRYDSALRLTFDESVYGDLDTDEGEDELDQLNLRLHQLLTHVSTGEDIELDWRDDCEVEIHNVNQDKFYAKYGNDFISSI